MAASAAFCVAKVGVWPGLVCKSHMISTGGSVPPIIATPDLQPNACKTPVNPAVRGPMRLNAVLTGGRCPEIRALHGQPDRPSFRAKPNKTRGGTVPPVLSAGFRLGATPDPVRSLGFQAAHRPQGADGPKPRSP